jgi:hypothetical protein
MHSNRLSPAARHQKKTAAQAAVLNASVEFACLNRDPGAARGDLLHGRLRGPGAADARH